MKKIMLICLMCTFVFALESQKTESNNFTTANPLPVQEYNLPEIIEIKPADDPAPAWRYGDDIIIYNGDVNVDLWDMDNEAISVDYHRGDTLRAAIACVDSVVRIYISTDKGQSWAEDYGFLASTAFYEPEIIHASDGSYFHVFARASSGNGNIAAVRWDASGTFSYTWVESSSDTVRNYTVCSNRAEHLSDYVLYLYYHKGCGGAGKDTLLFTKSSNHGANWSTPHATNWGGSGYPDLTYGGGNYLYLTYLRQDTGGDIYARVRRSTNLGVNWQTSIDLESNANNKYAPQIASSYDGSGDVWLMYPREDLTTPNDDYGLRWSQSTDYGVNWSTPVYTNHKTDSNEVLPSISVYDCYGSTEAYPWVTFQRWYHDYTGKGVVLQMGWSGTNWGTGTSFNDTLPVYSRPSQTWTGPGDPAFAYVGYNAENVYFDSWENHVEENEPLTANKELVSSVRPNPFTKITHIGYSLPVKTMVNVKVYNILGQEVTTLFDGVKESGTHELEWTGIDKNGAALPKGIYFLKIETPDNKATKKIILE